MNSNRLTPEQAAALLGVSPQFIRIGLQQGKLPIGTAVKMSSKYTYCIPEQAVLNYMQYGGAVMQLCRGESKQ